MNNHEDDIIDSLKVVVKFNKSFQEVIDELLKYPSDNRAERVRILCLFGLIYLEEKNISKAATNVKQGTQPEVNRNQSHQYNTEEDGTFIETGKLIITKKDNTQETRDAILREIKF